MHTAAYTARAARNENGIARIAPDHDDFVAAEERGHRIRGQNFSLLQIGDGVEGKRAGDARHWIEIDVLYITVLRQEALDLRFAERLRAGIMRALLEPELVGSIIA